MAMTTRLPRRKISVLESAIRSLLVKYASNPNITGPRIEEDFPPIAYKPKYSASLSYGVRKLIKLLLAIKVEPVNTEARIKAT